jgi:alkanesulfonate monooxygenase SsuD/methylene tetrahydromethanopterin reductase-like flavin-dependent oxidoreductase (luciferase family)
MLGRIHFLASEEDRACSRWSGLSTRSCQKYTRDQLFELGASLPREWVETGCVVGSAAQCAERLRAYVDAGLDHLVLHGSSPDQLAGVVKLWRDQIRSGRDQT